MNLKGILYGLGIVAVLLLTWLLLHNINGKTDAAIVSQTLAPDDKAKVIVDTKRHTITTVTRSPDGVLEHTISVTKYLAPTASIEVKQDGTVVVTSRSFGTELSPWMGVSFDTEKHARITLGPNWFYWRRYELGSGLSIRTSDLDPRVFISASYNVYANTLLMVAVDNHKAVSLGLALKF